MKLYFIAIVPNEELREQIKSFKEKIKDKYGSKKALRLPAHITLQIPFKFSEENEHELISSLESFTKGQEPFQLNLNGFDCFPPRVIFIKVENHQPVIKLSTELQHVMKDFINPEGKQKSSSFHPHITIASRDLSKEAFRKAWSEFKERDFKASFLTKGLVLFRHNGKTWDICRELEFEK